MKINFLDLTLTIEKRPMNQREIESAIYLIGVVVGMLAVWFFIKV